MWECEYARGRTERIWCCVARLDSSMCEGAAAAFSSRDADATGPTGPAAGAADCFGPPAVGACPAAAERPFLASNAAAAPPLRAVTDAAGRVTSLRMLDAVTLLEMLEVRSRTGALTAAGGWRVNCVCCDWMCEGEVSNVVHSPEGTVLRAKGAAWLGVLSADLAPPSCFCWEGVARPWDSLAACRRICSGVMAVWPSRRICSGVMAVWPSRAACRRACSGVIAAEGVDAAETAAARFETGVAAATRWETAVAACVFLEVGVAAVALSLSFFEGVCLEEGACMKREAMTRPLAFFWDDVPGCGSLGGVRGEHRAAQFASSSHTCG